MHTIRQYESADEESVLQLSLEAWAPVFASMHGVLGDALYNAFYPDWMAKQAEDVATTLTELRDSTWVAVHDRAVAGFVSAGIEQKPMASGGRFGWIEMLAVDPARQGAGTGVALCRQALDWMRSEGVAVAGVETGGDPGHAPARATYEKAGFGLMPISRYFQAL